MEVGMSNGDFIGDSPFSMDTATHGYCEGVESIV